MVNPPPVTQAVDLNTACGGGTSHDLATVSLVTPASAKQVHDQSEADLERTLQQARAMSTGELRQTA